MVLDSTVWLEILLEQPLAERCKKFLKHAKVPALCLFEIYKKLRQKQGEPESLTAIAWVQNHPVLALNEEVALLAADLSTKYNLAMADSIVLSHSQVEQLELVTLDNDFNSIPGVRVIRD